MPVKVKEAMEVAMQAGEILLCSGSEIYRVEDTLRSICGSYKIDCEAFVMPTGIFISGSSRENPEDTVSLIKRIKRRTIDLHCIDLINSFSRKLEENPLSYEEAMEVLRQIIARPYFTFRKRVMAAGLTALAYALLFNGSAADALAAAVISMGIYSLNELVDRMGMSQFFHFFISGMLAGGASIMADRLYPALHMNTTIIGAIMILVPGVAITNGIKDALNGDLVASFSKLGEALFIAIAVGAGVGVALAAGMYWS